MNIGSLSKIEKGVAKTIYSSLGFSKNDQENGIHIGIISSFNLCSPMHAKVNQLCFNVQTGVASAGAKSSIMHVPGLDEFSALTPVVAKSAYAFRELTATNVQAICETNRFDALVLVSGGEHTVSGMVVGAIRTKLPFTVVTVGANLPNTYKGKTVTLSTVLQSAGAIAGGKLNSIDAEDMYGHISPYFTEGEGFYGGNSLAVGLEAMGLTVSGNAAALAHSGHKMEIAKRTGAIAVILAKEQLAPRKIITKQSVQNAAAVVCAMGGCVNTINNLVNFAKEVGVDVKTEALIESVSKVPTLVKLVPQGTHYFNDLDTAGNLPVLIKELTKLPKLIDTSALTVENTTIDKIIAKAENPDDEVIKTIANAYSKKPSVVSLKGNLAEKNALINVTNCNGVTTFSGKAWVYESIEEATNSILSKHVPNGGVVVVKNCGIKNGSINVDAVVNAIAGLEKSKEIAVITDGRCTNTSGGIVVTNCLPDTTDNEMFANLQNGDIIDIDITRNRIATNIKELKTRAKRNNPKSVLPSFARSLKL